MKATVSTGRRLEEAIMLNLGKICRKAALVLAPCLGALSTGCGFFPPITTCTTNCTTSTDFLYVANQSTTTAGSVAGFSLTTTTTAATATTPATSTLTLAATPNSAYSLGYIPLSMAITPNNKFLYVSVSSGGIYLYAINSNGSLILQNNGAAVASGFIASAIKVDTTGGYLLVATYSTATTNASMSVFSIASATGLLTANGKALALKTAGASTRLAIAPNNTNVFLTLGTGGVESFTFSATTGILTDVGSLAVLKVPNADQGVAVNPTSTLAFVTETGSSVVRVFSIGTNGGLTEVTAPFGTGLGPAGVLVDSSGSYVYVTNSTDGTISGYVLAANGTLTAISGSPFDTGTTPVDIAEDSTGKYVGVVCNGGGRDLEVYSFDATTGGALDAAANATTGTDPTNPIAIAVTH